MKIISIIFSFISVLLPTVLFANGDNLPLPVTRSTVYDNEGMVVIQTEILLDKNTSREDVIHTCNFLAKENIQLTFDRLDIRPSILGIAGRNRIAYVKGSIALPNGALEKFKAGNFLAFRSVKITFSKRADDNFYVINMVEIID